MPYPALNRPASPATTCTPRMAVAPRIRERLRGSRARLAVTLRNAELFSLTV